MYCVQLSFPVSFLRHPFKGEMQMQEFAVPPKHKLIYSHFPLESSNRLETNSDSAWAAHIRIKAATSFKEPRLLKHHLHLNQLPNNT